MQRHWSGWRGTLGKSSPRWIVGCWRATERLIICIFWSNTRRSYQFRCWSTPSRARQVGCFAGTGQPSPLAIATVLCGRRPISLRRPAALRSSSSMSSNRGSALPPRPKGRSFRALKDWGEATRSSVWPLPHAATNSLLKFSRPQKSGLSARGTSASFPEYHWMFSAQASSAQSVGSFPRLP
jgi:hypothetical protein